jgi:hypothetical protein
VSERTRNQVVVSLGDGPDGAATRDLLDQAANFHGVPTSTWIRNTVFMAAAELALAGKIVMKLNHNDSTPVEAIRDTIPPPSAEQYIHAMQTLGRLWEPQVVSCAHCGTHIALNQKSDLDHFIQIHSGCEANS